MNKGIVDLFPTYTICGNNFFFLSVFIRISVEVLTGLNKLPSQRRIKNSLCPLDC